MDRLARGIAKTSQRVASAAMQAGEKAMDAAQDVSQIVRATNVVQAGQHIVATKVLRTVDEAKDTQFEAQAKAGKDAARILSAVDGHFAAIAHHLVDIGKELEAAMRQLTAFRAVVEPQLIDPLTGEGATVGTAAEIAALENELSENVQKHVRNAVSTAETLRTGCRIANEAVQHLHAHASDAGRDVRQKQVQYDLARHELVIAEGDCVSSGLALSSARQSGDENAAQLAALRELVVAATDHRDHCLRQETATGREFMETVVSHREKFRFEFEQVTIAAWASVNVLVTEMRVFYEMGQQHMGALGKATLGLKNRLSIAKRITDERRDILAKRKQLAESVNSGSQSRADASAPSPTTSAGSSASPATTTGAQAPTFDFFDQQQHAPAATAEGAAANAAATTSASSGAAVPVFVDPYPMGAPSSSRPAAVVIKPAVNLDDLFGF